MLRRLDPDSIRFIGTGNPVLGRALRAAKVHVTLDKALAAHGMIDIDVPDLVEQFADAGPVAVIKQQVIAFGDDELRIGEDRDRVGDRLLDLAPELGRIDDLVGLLFFRLCAI